MISTYQHVKSGTEHIFIGSGSNGKVKMTSDIASGDKVVISSAPKEKVAVDGATSQPGSGDPSPDNIRMIDGVGMYDQCVVFDGSEDEDWQLGTTGTEGKYRLQIIATPKVTKVPATSVAPIKSDRFRTISATGTWDNQTGIAAQTNNIYIYSEEYQTVQSWKSYLAENPLTVWYRSVDFYKCKGPFYYVHEVSDGTESPYKATGIELNAPLFDGDSLKVGGKSGCDQMLLFDGSDDETWSIHDTRNGVTNFIINYRELGPSLYGTREAAYSNRLKRSFRLFIDAATARENETFLINTSSQIYLRSTQIADVVGLKTDLKAHPLIVFYKSVNYTPEADIAVALEKHLKTVKIFDGTEQVDIVDQTGPGAAIRQFRVSAFNGTTPFTGVCSHYKNSFGGSWYGIPEYGWMGLGNENTIRFRDSRFSTSEDFNAHLAAQHTAGTPVQVVYELASAVTYAHPIQTEALPAYYGTEDFVTALAGEKVAGKWLTFTNDGAQLNFKGGGGVGVSKLAATTAVPADVVSGKTFYSKDKTLKTGTLADKPALNDAVSVGNDGNYLYARINVGAYRTKQSTGYPEIRFPNSDAIENIPGGDNGAWNGTYSGSNVTIPKGYHNGNGSVGVAGGNRGNWSGTYSGSDVTIPQGYHAGGGKVGVAGGNRGNWNGTYSGSDVAIPKGYHAGGGKVSVSGGNKGAWGSTINPGGSVTIPKGYHNGSGVVKANGNSINFHPIDRTVGWGSGVRFTGEDATPGASGKMRFVLKYWCRTEYNVTGYIRVLRNDNEIHATKFEKHYDSPYNDDVPNGYINVEFSGSGTYQIQVSVDYNAGNGEIKMGGAFIGY